MEKKQSLSERAKQAARDFVKKVRPSKGWPINHPHVNPHYREGKGGPLFFWMENRQGRRLFVSRQDVGRWVPHNGAREMARRRRQMEARHGAA